MNEYITGLRSNPPYWGNPIGSEDRHHNKVSQVLRSVNLNLRVIFFLARVDGALTFRHSTHHLEIAVKNPEVGSQEIGLIV